MMSNIAKVIAKRESVLKTIYSTEENGQAIYLDFKDFVWKLFDIDGSFLGNGFQYCGPNAGILITCEHVVHGKQSVRGEKCTRTGHQVITSVLAEFEVRASNMEIDCAVLVWKGSPTFQGINSFSGGSLVNIGEPLHLIGYKALGEVAEPVLIIGRVCLVEFKCILADIYADYGFSGSPVFNNFGLLVGLLKSGEGTALPRAAALAQLTPSGLINGFLAGNGCPLLR